jgi:hypothetical protein
MKQLAQTVEFTRFQVVEARIARWLLLTQARAQSNFVHVPHVFWRASLGVPRVALKPSHASDIGLPTLAGMIVNNGIQTARITKYKREKYDSSKS